MEADRQGVQGLKGLYDRGNSKNGKNSIQTWGEGRGEREDRKKKGPLRAYFETQSQKFSNYY